MNASENQTPKNAPETRSGRLMRVRPDVLMFLAFLLVVIGFYGEYLNRPHGGSDDFLWRIELLRSAHGDMEPAVDRSLLGRLIGVASGRLVSGHFAPVRGFIWVLIAAVTGVRNWLVGIVFFGMVLHAATGAMIGALVRRLGGGFAAAAVAGLIFVAHPMSDSPLSGANQGMNIYGIFFTAWMLLAFDGIRPGQALRARTFVGAIFAFFAAINSNAIFILVTPLALAGWSIARLVSERPAFVPWVTALFGRAVPFAAALGLTLVWRKAANGTIFSPAEEKISVVPGRLGYVASMLNQYIFLDAGRDARHFKLAIDEVPAAVGSSTHRALLARTGIIAAFVLLIIAARRWTRESPSGPGTSPPSASGSLLALATAGGLLFFGATLSYWSVRGEIMHHRYYDVGLLGLAIVAALAVRPIEMLIGHTAVRAACVTLLMAYPLIRFAEIAEASEESYAYARDACAAVSERAAAVLDEDPAIEGVFVLELPRAVGRVGLLFNEDGPLTAAARFAHLERRYARDPSPVRAALPYVLHQEALIEKWERIGAGDEDVRLAVLVFDAQTLGLRRAWMVENDRALLRPVLTFRRPRNPADPANSPEIHRIQSPFHLLSRADLTAENLLAWAAVNPRQAERALRFVETTDSVLVPAIQKMTRSPVPSLARTASEALLRMGRTVPPRPAPAIPPSKDSVPRLSTDAMNDGLEWPDRIAAFAALMRIADLDAAGILARWSAAGLPADVFWAFPEIADASAPLTSRRMLMVIHANAALPIDLQKRTHATWIRLFPEENEQAMLAGHVRFRELLERSAAEGTAAVRDDIRDLFKDLKLRAALPEAEALLMTAGVK